MHRSVRRPSHEDRRCADVQHRPDDPPGGDVRLVPGEGQREDRARRLKGMSTSAPAGGNMRDQHKSKHELTEETVGLRKQVDDLKTSIAARRRVEDALRESDELHRSLVDSLPTAIWCLDARGHLLAANRALAELLGYDSRSELLQLGAVLGIFADLEEEKRVLARLMSGSPVRQLHARCRTKLGAGLPVAIS